MRSQLTRTIFRRLLSSEPTLFRPCHRTLPRRNAVLYPSFQAQKRSLFFFGGSKQQKTAREPQLDPGLLKMIDLTTMDKIHARPPPRQDLVKAWNAFFTYKKDKGEPVNNYQVLHNLRCFRHLMKGASEVGDAERLQLADLRLAAKALTNMPNDKRETHNELSRELYREIVRMVDDMEGVGSHSTSTGAFSDLLSYVIVLTQSGDTLEAKSIVLEYFEKRAALWGPDQKGKAQDRTRANKGMKVLMKGFSREGNEAELITMVDLAESLGCSYSPSVHLIMTKFYASRDDVESTKRWFSKTPHSAGDHAQDETRAPESYSVVLEFCIRNNELEWCKSVFRDLLETGNVSKPKWDIIFQWAAGTLGKGVEEVERMFEVMKRANEDNPRMRPDISTINGLISMAVSLNDPYLAERYIALGIKHRIQPNAETLIHQLGYRIDAGDLSGAYSIYEALQSEEVLAQADVPVINKYIRALCAAKTPNFDLIVSICTELDERNARLQPETVSDLAILYLDRGEVEELIDTLQAQSFHYTTAERFSIRDALLAYTLNPSTPTIHAWNSYTIFRQLFDDTNISIRTQAMNEFFRRGRSDMALHTFGHMRAHIRPDMRPLISTYIDCFCGIASCADEDSLRIVHNMLKMDSSIEPNTALYNSLMLAYASCGDGHKAVSYWDQITNSNEGPSYRSLEIVFRACEQKPMGDKKAREIWTKMRRMEIEVTKEVFVAYIGALAGQGQLEEAKSVVESGLKDFEIEPDFIILGTMYNAIPGQNRKDMIEAWAKDIYPDAWTELEKLGQTTHEEGHRLFNMPPLHFKA